MHGSGRAVVESQYDATVTTESAQSGISRHSCRVETATFYIMRYNNMGLAAKEQLTQLCWLVLLSPLIPSSDI